VVADNWQQIRQMDIQPECIMPSTNCWWQRHNNITKVRDDYSVGHIVSELNSILQSPKATG